MKRLILINGTMGVGKTAVSSALYRLLPNSVFLDGDWCWMMDPFVVTTETKAMVLDNISHLLNNFIRCSQYENILFCWVMDQQEILDSVLSRLDLAGCTVRIFTLTASAPALTKRIREDIRSGFRCEDDLARSLACCSHSETMATEHLDTSQLTVSAVAAELLQRLET